MKSTSSNTNLLKEHLSLAYDYSLSTYYLRAERIIPSSLGMFEDTL
jgi:hypothetical protein